MAASDGVVFVALASKNSQDALPFVNEEGRTLSKMFLRSKGFRAETHWDASYLLITRVFNKYNQDILLFHFAGHGNGEGIRVLGDRSRNEDSMLFAQGVANFLANDTRTKLVFLNACCTEDQVRVFHEAGIPAVVATTHPVRDEIAYYFAAGFYDALSLGRNLEDSYQAALNAARGKVAKAEDMYLRDLMSWKRPGDFNPAIPYKLYHTDKLVLGQTLADWNTSAAPAITDASPEAPEKIADSRDDAYLLCNRRLQRKTFCRTIEKNKEKGDFSPQVFFVHGHKDEIPKKMLSCLLEYELLSLLAVDRDKIRLAELEFVGRQSFHKKDDRAWEELISMLKKKLGWNPAWGEFSATGLINHLSNYEVLWIEHELKANSWDGRMKEFMLRYLRDFWGELGTRSGTQVYICFHIHYDKDSYRGLMSTRWKIHKALKYWEAQFPEQVCVLEELDLVEKEDVLKWVDKYLRPMYEREVDSLYGEEERMCMRKVRQLLDDLLQQYSRGSLLSN